MCKEYLNFLFIHMIYLKYLIAKGLYLVLESCIFSIFLSLWASKFSICQVRLLIFTNHIVNKTWRWNALLLYFKMLEHQVCFIWKVTTIKNSSITIFNKHWHYCKAYLLVLGHLSDISGCSEIILSSDWPLLGIGNFWYEQYNTYKRECSDNLYQINSREASLFMSLFPPSINL